MCLKFGKAVWNMTWKKGLPTLAIGQLQPKVNEFALFTLDIATTKPNHPGTSIIHNKADCFSLVWICCWKIQVTCDLLNLVDCQIDVGMKWMVKSLNQYFDKMQFFLEIQI